MSDNVHAPWIAKEVEALNAFQKMPEFHGYTCPGHSGGGSRLLVATRKGWICCHCDYKQTHVSRSALKMALYLAQATSNEVAQERMEATGTTGVAKGIKVLAIGSRFEKNRNRILEALDDLDRERGPLKIVYSPASGGVGRHVEDWAILRKRERIPYVSEWREKGGASQGTIVTRIFNKERPDAIVIFNDNSIGRRAAATAKMRSVEVINLFTSEDSKED